MKRTRISISNEQALELFSSDSFLTVNKRLLSYYGPEVAVFLCNLIDKLRYFQQRNQLEDGEWFYLIHAHQIQQTGLTEHKLRRCKQILRDDEIIDTCMRGKPAKEKYRLLLPNLIKTLENKTSKNPRAKTSKNPRANIKENKKDKETSSSDFPKNGYITPSQFEKFWNLYPKKAGKGAALSKWNTICGKPPKDRPTWVEIKKAVFHQKKSDQWQNAKYIPHATTWLNQNRWLDDPEQMKSYSRDNEKPDTFIEYGERWTKGEDGSYRNSKGTIFTE